MYKKKIPMQIKEDNEYENEYFFKCFIVSERSSLADELIDRFIVAIGFAAAYIRTVSYQVYECYEIYTSAYIPNVFFEYSFVHLRR